MNQNIVYMLA